MANKTVDSLTAATSGLLTDEFYLTRSPYGVGDDRKITLANLIATLHPTGAGDPNGVVTALYAGQLYTQVSGGVVTNWNATTAGGTVWV
jgi:hypothetical protein